MAHRSRLGVDVMALQLGPPGGAPTFTQQFSDGNTAWGRYSGTYTVPAGQITTRIGFVAISATGGQPNFGNFIDEVALASTSPPCTPTPIPSATPGGTVGPGATGIPGPGRGPNRHPDARPDRVTTTQRVAVTLDVLANDSDPDRDPLSVFATTEPERGTVSCQGTRPTLCLYTPEVEYVGNDGFEYTVSDGRGGVARARVSVAALAPGARLDVKLRTPASGGYVDLAGALVGQGGPATPATTPSTT